MRQMLNIMSESSAFCKEIIDFSPIWLLNTYLQLGLISGNAIQVYLQEAPACSGKSIFGSCWKWDKRQILCRKVQHLANKLLIFLQFAYWIFTYLNVWSIKIHTIHKLSLWLYYNFFGKFHISCCKFLMPRPLQWSTLGAHTIILPKNIHEVTKTDYVWFKFYRSDVMLANTARQWAWGLVPTNFWQPN